MVRALSDAFETDLRGEFTDLNFPISDMSFDALPVELVSFTFRVKGTNEVQLNWRTQSEINNFGFEVERSTDNGLHTANSPKMNSKNWIKIGFVKGSGNSNSQKNYSFTDSETGFGDIFYRLKQIDNDGKFKYSKVINVKLEYPSKFELSQNYPNPVSLSVNE